MAEETIRQMEFTLESESREDNIEWAWYHLLPAVSLAIYIFTPIMIWKFGLPDEVKYFADLIVIAMIALAVAHMVTIDRIPGYFMAIMALTVISAIVATFEGQSPSVTAWGWWMMFRFPMVGLFAYLLPNWPRQLAAKIPWWMLYLLAFQVLVQAVLYATGTRDFDDLAGTFGKKGVGAYILFIVIVLVIALGQWLVKGEWKMLASTLALGAFASALGEMKFFVIAAPLLASITLILHLLRGGQLRKLFVYLIFFALAASAFFYGYDRFIVQGLGRPSLEEYLNEDKRDNYLENVRGGGDEYRLGRNTEAQYGWELIQRDPATLLFGYGLGTRQNSPQLGLTGVGLDESLYGDLVGRTLLVMMYEMGLVGLFALLVLIVLSAAILYRSALQDPDEDMNVLRYGVLIFTIIWPFLIWYKAVWIRVEPMLLYWLLWGFVMHFSIGPYFVKSEKGPSQVTSEQITQRM